MMHIEAGVGDRVRQVRGKRSRRKFAEPLGLDQSSVAKWEQGKTTPQPTALIAIGTVHGVSVDWLRTGTGPMRASPGLDTVLKLEIDAGQPMSEERRRWTPPSVGSGDAEQVRLTPDRLVYEAEERWGRRGFTMDAACTAETCVVCRLGGDYCEDHPVDSLAVPWFGNVWCNPPWNDCVRWMDKALREVQRGNANVVVMLLPVRGPTTRWTHANPCTVHPIYGRPRFKGSGDHPFEDAMFVVLERPIDAADFR